MGDKSYRVEYSDPGWKAGNGGVSVYAADIFLVCLVL